MFSENSRLQEELCAVGNIGKIETGVPSFLSGKSSSELSIGLRKSNYIQIENIEVDETILNAGDFTQVKPGKIHQFEGIEDGVAFELYWAEFNHDDIVRRTVGTKVKNG